MMAAVYQLGYRLAMLCAGAGALYIADFVSWRAAYLAMAGLTVVGIARLPAVAAARPAARARPARRRFAVSFVEPLADLVRRYGATLVAILALVAIYRLPDFVSGVMANPLYIDLGFTKSDIATVSKLYGVWIGMAGAFARRRRVARLGLMPSAADRRRRRLRLASDAGLSRRARARKARPADARRQRRELCLGLRRRGADRLHVVAGLAGLRRDAIRAAVLALRAAGQIRRRPLRRDGRRVRLRPTSSSRRRRSAYRSSS